MVSYAIPTLAGVAVVALVGGLTYALHRSMDLYDGPSGIESVANIDVNIIPWTDHTFSVLKADGIGITADFTDGTDAWIRDYNADFDFNGRDYVKGDLPDGVSAQDILNDAQIKVPPPTQKRKTTYHPIGLF